MSDGDPIKRQENGADRDPKGRFAPGNPGGPGRRSRPSELEYLDALTEACPVERWRAICERATRDAENGDHRARHWLARYLVPEVNVIAAIDVREELREINERWRLRLGEAELQTAEEEAMKELRGRGVRVLR